MKKIIFKSILSLFSISNLFSLSLLGEWDYDLPVSTAVKDSFVYVGSGSGVYIFKFKNSNFIRESQFWTGENVINTNIKGDTLFVFTDLELKKYIITDPLNPSLIGQQGLVCPPCTSYVYKAEIQRGVPQVLLSEQSPLWPGFWGTIYKIPGLYETGTPGIEKWHAFAFYDSFSFLSSDTSIQVFRLSSGFPVSELVINDKIIDMETKDSFLFGISLQNFWVFDISKPESIKVLLTDPNLKGKGLVLKDSILFIRGVNKIYIVNVKDPLNPFVYSTLSPGGGRISVGLNNIFYIRNGVISADISDLYNPVEVSSYNNFPSRDVSALYLYDSLVIVGSEGFWVVDISDPTKPFETGGIPWSNFNYGRINRIDVKDSIAFLALETGIYSVDFSNPYSPFIVNSVNRLWTKDLVINDSFLYFTSDTTLFISRIDNNGNITLIDSFPFNTPLLTLKKGKNRLYSLLNTESFNPLKIAVFDISQPDSPSYITTMEFTTSGSSFYPDFGVYDSLLFLGSFVIPLGYGPQGWLLHIFDISDPLNPFLVDSFPNPLDLANEFIVKGDYLWIGGYRDTIDSDFPYGGFEVRNIKDNFKVVLTDSSQISSYFPYDYYSYVDAPLHVFFVGDSILLWIKGAVKRGMFPYTIPTGFQIYKFHLPSTYVNEKSFSTKENSVKISFPFLIKGVIPFTVYLSESKRISFSLFNISGRKVFESEVYKLNRGFSKGKIILPKDFPGGIYWVKVKGLQQKKPYKIIVLK